MIILAILYLLPEAFTARLSLRPLLTGGLAGPLGLFSLLALAVALLAHSLQSPAAPRSIHQMVSWILTLA